MSRGQVRRKKKKSRGGADCHPCGKCPVKYASGASKGCFPLKNSGKPGRTFDLRGVRGWPPGVVRKKNHSSFDGGTLVALLDQRSPVYWQRLSGGTTLSSFCLNGKNGWILSRAWSMGFSDRAETASRLAIRELSRIAPFDSSKLPRRTKLIATSCRMRCVFFVVWVLVFFCVLGRFFGFANL